MTILEILVTILVILTVGSQASERGSKISKSTSDLHQQSKRERIFQAIGNQSAKLFWPNVLNARYLSKSESSSDLLGSDRSDGRFQATSAGTSSGGQMLDPIQRENMVKHGDVNLVSSMVKGKTPPEAQPSTKNSPGSAIVDIPQETLPSSPFRPPTPYESPYANERYSWESKKVLGDEHFNKGDFLKSRKLQIVSFVSFLFFVAVVAIILYASMKNRHPRKLDKIYPTPN